MRAIWNDTVLAESDDTIVVEGNHYFPPESLRREHFRESSTHTVCGWKGVASYYDVVVGEQVNAGAAWYYPTPKAAAEHIRGRVAFWKGVSVGHPPETVTSNENGASSGTGEGSSDAPAR